MSDYSHPPGSLYAYQPSQALPIILAVTTLILYTALAYQSIIHKWYYFFYLTTLASVAWLGGFVTRAITTFPIQDPVVYVNLFISQYVLIFLGPPFFAASESFILGRLLAYMPYHAPLHPGRTISTFVILNAIVEALAVTGATRSANQDAADSQRAVGHKLVEASLVLQMFIELCFITIVAIFERRGRRPGPFPRNVRVLCRVLYITSLMMLVRCVVRIIEGFQVSACPGLAQLWCGAIRRNEWFLWTFEVANIELFVAALALWHPGRYLPNDQRVYLDPVDHETERMGPGYGKSDKRNFFVTLFDPSDIVGTWRGKDNINRFWERENPVVGRLVKGRRSEMKLETEMQVETESQVETVMHVETVTPVEVEMTTKV